jgi:3',5'-cyclic AMP phosphodiesterase CpdA
MPLLYHISDLHFGAEDRAALDWLAREVGRERPDGVVCTGDLTMRGLRREFAAAGAYLAGLGVPVSVEPGNHDMPYYWEMAARLARPFARFEAMRAGVHSDLALDGVRVVSMPTVVPAQWRLNWSKGCVRRRVLARALAQAAGPGVRLVACHHPLVDADTRGTGSTRGGRRALAALAALGVDAVLSGHVHDPFDRVVETAGGPIRIIGAGTLSERVRVSAPGFNRIEVLPGGALDVRVVTRVS